MLYQLSYAPGLRIVTPALRGTKRVPRPGRQEPGGVYWTYALRPLSHGAIPEHVPMTRPLLFATCALLAAAPAAAQDERWQVTLDGQEYVWDIRLVRLDGDSLLVRQADSLRALPVDRISEIRLIRKSEVQLGAGATAGALGALLGSDDEVYDFSPLEFPDRIRAIQRILLYHPVEGT